MKIFSGDKVNVANERALGDQARDAANWSEAVRHYSIFLEQNPEDSGILTQMGNCAKEMRQFKLAKESYEKAAKLDPDNFDIFLQMGHLSKIEGRRRDAIEDYKKALSLNSSSQDARRELLALGVKTGLLSHISPMNALKDKSALFIDVSDLLAFLQVHVRVTGIQRVQSCIVDEVIRNCESERGAYNAGDVVFVYCDQDKQSFHALQNEKFHSLVTAALSSDTTQNVLVDLLGEIREDSIKIEPRQGDVYVILGAFWIGNDYSSSLLKLKSRGVKAGVYIYDLIPITHSQYVTESTRQAVVDKFGDVMSLMDFALTISEFVAVEVRQVLSEELGRNIPVISVPLAHELPDSQGDDERERVSSEFIDRIPERYALCVCTLEGRKNHLLLVNSWAALARKHGADLPSLLLVGKWGWRADEFRSQLVASKYVGGKIAVIGNVSDAELKHLYENCLFTIFPSFVEGWGLPVGESLAYGKPCIASNTSSIPEVGGDFCRYIDPYDLLGATKVIEETIFDSAALKAWSERIRRDFRPRKWSEVAQTFIDKTKAAAASGSVSLKPSVSLSQGVLYKTNRGAIYSGAGATSWASRSLKFVMSSGWKTVEDWGVWTNKPVAVLSFGVNGQENKAVRLFLKIQIPPPALSGDVRISDHNGAAKVVLLSSQKQIWVSFDTTTDSNGLIKIAMERLDGVEQLNPETPIFVGLSALGFYVSSDLNGRVNLMESIVLDA